MVHNYSNAYSNGFEIMTEIPVLNATCLNDSIYPAHCTSISCRLL